MASNFPPQNPPTPVTSLPSEISSTLSFSTHARGHGSFSANTVRSPLSSAQDIKHPPGTYNPNQDGHATSTSAIDDRLDLQDTATKAAVHRLNTTGSVQALVVDDDVLFAGLQGGEIVAWSLETYEQLARVHAHAQSVLGLSLSEDKSLLFSCGVDGLVNVWSTQSLKRLFSLASYFEVGDVFCVTYSARTRTLFCGAQNSSIQWYRLEGHALGGNVSSTNSVRKHRFFDSLGPGGAPAELPETDDPDSNGQLHGGRMTMIPQTNYLQYAHKSYIYSIVLATGLFEHNLNQEILITAGGGGTIKLWSLEKLSHGKPILLEKFKNKGSSVFSLAYKAPFLYAGLSNGVAHVYNLASHQLVQRLSMDCGDILQIQIANKSALCGTSDGWIKRTSNQFTEVEKWVGHTGKILATAMSNTSDNQYFITGGNDNCIALWDVSDRSSNLAGSAARSNDELVNALRQFVSYRTVAGNPHCVSDCHQAVTFLRKQFNSFGASTSFISPEDGINPILLAKFSASSRSKSAKTVLFYGHYDVIDADLNGSWHADPFTLHPLNGFLYGRGVTDNKGPILAALYAVADLAQHNALTCNVVFLLEGDEEAGSRGFRSAVRQHRAEIGEVDFIMLSNSYWLDDHIPCLTFGMRGVIHASLTITSNKPDLHSGVDGRLLQHEPLKDLTVLLSSLIGDTGTDIKIPDFFQTVDTLHSNELKAYSAITSALGSGHPEIKDQEGFMRSLMQKWRNPNLTIHQIQVPESKTAVTISRSAKATLSIRIVPSQSADEIAAQLEKYVSHEFSKLGSTNILSVKITSKADPWLGKISSQIYSALKKAVTDVWSSEEPASQRSFPQEPSSGVGPNKPAQSRRGSGLITTGTYTSSNTPREPLFIREGGSIPAISFLEKEFDAPAAMFPMGQASDNAHLDNERMRLENLYKGREVLKRVFAQL